LFGVTEPPPGEVPVAAAAEAAPANGTKPVVPPPLPPRRPDNRTREDPANIRREPNEGHPQRRPIDAARPTGVGALIGMLAVFFVGFFVLMGGVIYLLWPTSSPADPLTDGPPPPQPPPVVVEPPKKLDDILKEAPGNERGNRPGAAPEWRNGIPPGAAFQPPGAPGAPALTPIGPRPPRVIPAPGGAPTEPPKFAPVVPLPIKPARFTGSRFEVSLPGPVESAVPAAGGRLLLLHAPKAGKVLVFDVTDVRIAKEIDAPDADTMLAAGMNVFVLYRPEANTLERWSCNTLDRQAEVKKPFADPVKAMAMGCASNGPLGAALGGERSTPLRGATLAYFDPATMREVRYGIAGKDNPFGVGPGEAGGAVRMSANGTLATAWARKGAAGIVSEVINGGQITRYHKLGIARSALPSPDGQMIYADYNRIAPELPLEIPAPTLRDRWLAPGVQGDWYVAVRQPVLPTGRPDAGSPTVQIFRSGRARPEVGFDFVDDLDMIRVGAGEIDQCLFLVPDAQVLVTVAAPKRSKLVLRRVELK
jgi:hypothetical protein